jgi:hypothetical protein
MMSWTHKDVERHTPFLGDLSAPVRGWRIDSNGNVGEDVTIPAGAKVISHDRMGCVKLLAMYGEDRGIAHFVMPDNSIVELFFRLTDAERSFPDEPEGFNWCTLCQRYHMTPCDG